MSESPGVIDIIRTISNVRGDYITIRIGKRTPDGRKKLVRAEMSLADFALALTGQSQVSCVIVEPDDGR